MVDAAKAFAKEPPRTPLVDLEAIVADFQWRYVERKKTDQVIRYCRKSKNFAEAVRRAVESRDKDGKHHNHQSKVDITARRQFGSRIIAYKKDIKRIRDHTGPGDDVFSEFYRPFDALHDLFDSIKPFGIGPVTVYDVAVRVGAFLEIEPESVYMHAGVKQGLKALIDAMGRASDPKLAAAIHGAEKLPRVPMYLFPKPLKKMRADDVEDILCTYREVFETW